MPPAKPTPSPRWRQLESTGSASARKKEKVRKGERAEDRGRQRSRRLKGRLKNIGGSQSDHWNNTLANQAVQALWLKNSDAEDRKKQLSATVAALIGIGPKEELEGMLAAQLIAAHNAAMECYRRAMIGEQTFDLGAVPTPNLTGASGL